MSKYKIKCIIYQRLTLERRGNGDQRDSSAVKCLPDKCKVLSWTSSPFTAPQKRRGGKPENKNKMKKISFGC